MRWLEKLRALNPLTLIGLLIKEIQNQNSPKEVIYDPETG